MAILVNLYIAIVILYTGEYLLVLSPLLGTAVLAVLYILLKKRRLSANKTFFIGAYVIATEVCIHTHFFGWESGVIYFFFPLPAVLLLNFEVKIWQIISFCISIAMAFVYFRFFHVPSQVPAIVTSKDSIIINYINAILTGSIFIVLLVYYSRTIYKIDRILINVITDLEVSNREIGKHNEHQKVLLKEIHHRVKNNLQIISSLMSLQSRNVENDEVLDVLNESRRRVQAIALIHQKLYQDDKGNKVDFKAYLEEFVQSHRTLNSRVHFSLHSDEVTLHLDCAVPLGLIISEMFTNAIKHAFDNVEQPELHVSVTLNHPEIEVWIRDNGNGFPPHFDICSEGLGLGMDIILSLTEQIDAKIDYFNDSGANFKVNFINRITE